MTILIHCEQCDANTHSGEQPPTTWVETRPVNGKKARHFCSIDCVAAFYAKLVDLREERKAQREREREEYMKSDEYKRRAGITLR